MIEEWIPALSAKQRADPHPSWRHWLDEGPVRRVQGQLVLLGYDDVRAALAHPDLVHWPADTTQPFGAASRRWLSAATDPGGSVRTAIVSQIRPAWRQLDVEALIASYVDDFGGGDLVAGVARALVWDIAVRLLGPWEVAPPDAPLAEALPGLAREAPGPWTVFVEAIAGGSVLAPVVGAGGLVFAAFLLYALIDNLRNAIGLAAHALIAHPAFAKLVASGSGRTAAALLRYDSPVQAVPLLARRDTVVSGAQLAAGDTALAAVGAAHRDPAVFQGAECPRLDPAEPPPLSFGYGPLRCLGASLATDALDVFARRFARIAPSLRFVEQPTWEAMPPFLRGPTSLLVERR